VDDGRGAGRRRRGHDGAYDWLGQMKPERIVPAAVKMISLSDMNGLGLLTQTVNMQDGSSYSFPLSISEARYMKARLDAVLTKFDEENVTE